MESLPGGEPQAFDLSGALPVDHILSSTVMLSAGMTFNGL
jgi:hypothetical protein